LTGVARNYFSLVGEYHCLFLVEREISKSRLDLSIERKLAAALPAIPPIGSAPGREFPVKVGQLIDGIGAADLFVGRFPEPRKSLFEQLEHPLGKAPRWVILFGHRITSIIFVVDERQIRNSAQSQPKRLSCTGTAAAGQGVLLISVLTGSTKCRPS
jgi:hypothetical protein